MTTYFISRHPGAQQWAREHGICVDIQLAHLDISDVQAGDVVIGSLPVNLVAELIRKQARYLHLVLDLPHAWRGKELSAAQMKECNARLEEYQANKVEP
ncbi:CRISPR-associated protein Csx16 [Methylomarinum vadi]|uniref:CRISPR-associated protein Csx16 n=1 Tax=Methylomarinum vadi TaxID=438855 RepID=UPI0004DFC2EF|nr:CRISPR-associated protein Csx16 [Methylomarinum vadi]